MARPALHRMLRHGLSCLLLAAAAALPRGASADDLELRVKAAFLYNFARFTSWPAARLAAADAPIRFCLPESDAMAPALEAALAGKAIDGHPLQLRRLGRGEDFRDCQVAYLGTVDSARLPAVLAALPGGVMSVYEAEAALHDGVVRFYLDERKVHFEINEAAAEREGLQLSSRLLGLASVVRE